MDGHGPAMRTFACHTASDPARVWTALTDPGASAGYLYGLSAHSTWEVDAPIDVRHGEHVTLSGRVLCVRPGERLSYVLQSGPDDPPVYVTWLIRRHANGSTIRLEVDEVGSEDSAEDAEDAWLPVLAALQQMLSAG